MPQNFEFGLDTFGDVTIGPNGELRSHAQAIRDVIDEGVLADELGIDAFGVGEHHRPNFSVSAPEVVLAAIAGRTRRIRLGSAVTVLSSDDPIRVFERFSTLNAASSGRAEVTLGRGSFIESFPLFGYDLSQYEVLFEDKLDLFAALIRSDAVTWQGQTRPPLKDQRVFPPIEGAPLRTWIGVGGSPESVVRAARYELPLALAIIGGDPARFRPYVDLYHRAFAQLGKPALPIASIRLVTLLIPTRRPARNIGKATRRCMTASAPSAAGRRWRAARSSKKSSAARCMSARQKRSRARSPRPRKRSASCGSI
jgi:alkanesulfonate monooxygenase SsuD/methylene tetrahydromethanopterin reductase-like flavin-dependent oxidoreductase (luciferase family)